MASGEDNFKVKFTIIQKWSKKGRKQIQALAMRLITLKSHGDLSVDMPFIPNLFTAHSSVQNLQGLYEGKKTLVLRENILLRWPIFNYGNAHS